MAQGNKIDLFFFQISSCIFWGKNHIFFLFCEAAVNCAQQSRVLERSRRKHSSFLHYHKEYFIFNSLSWSKSRLCLNQKVANYMYLSIFSAGYLQERDFGYWGDVWLGLLHPGQAFRSSQSNQHLEDERKNPSANADLALTICHFLQARETFTSLIVKLH